MTNAELRQERRSYYLSHKEAVDRRRELVHEKKNAKSRELYMERKAQGLCTVCGRAARQGYTTCFACAVRKSEQSKASYKAKKEK